MVAVLLALAISGIRPDPKMTPGVVRPLTTQQVCATHWGKDRRHVTTAMKKHVFAAYGIPYADHAKYEVDHFIPRSLGGADDVSNLWPQKWDGPTGAHAKDRLEVRLGVLVCSGQLSLHAAQEAIRSDWLAAFRLYVRPQVTPRDTADRLESHAVLFRQFGQQGATLARGADLNHLPLSQFRGSRTRPARGKTAPLHFSVYRIVFRRAEEQMIGAYAGRIVAAMKNAQPQRNSAMRKHPRNAVRLDFCPECGAASKRPRDVTITEFGALAGPLPAQIALGDVLPKVGERLDSLSKSGTTLIAETSDQGLSFAARVGAAKLADGNEIPSHGGPHHTTAFRQVIRDSGGYIQIGYDY